jgi:asparagine synthase (glutamine-hydrolysing)
LDKTGQSIWAGPLLQAAVANSDILWPLRRHWHSEYPPVLAAQFMDFHCFLVDHCLHKVDRASMACGVEARVPLLDPELIALIFSVDHGIMYSGGERKSLLKKALQKYLPVGLDTNRKKGFSSPMGIWLEKGLAKSGKLLLVEGGLCSSGYINPDAVLKYYDSAGPGIQLLLLGAELWFRRWFAENNKLNMLL